MRRLPFNTIASIPKHISIYRLFYLYHYSVLDFQPRLLCFGLDFSAGSYIIFRMWPGYCCHAVVSCSHLPNTSLYAYCRCIVFWWITLCSGGKKTAEGGFCRAHGVLDLNLRISSHLMWIFLACVYMTLKRKKTGSWFYRCVLTTHLYIRNYRSDSCKWCTIENTEIAWIFDVSSKTPLNVFLTACQD